MRVLRSIWALLVWLFLLAIPVQFYLAGQGAMAGAHAADNGTKVASSTWDPHAMLGTLMGLLAILILLAALGGRVPRRLTVMSLLLLVFMVIQFLLPAFNDSGSTRAIAALHPVNALIVTGLAVGLAIRSRVYLPFGRGQEVVEERGAVPAGISMS